MTFHPLLAPIAGDIIGSRYEKHALKNTEFPLFSAQSRFTDDTVLTVAVAEVCLNPGLDYVSSLKYWGRKHPFAGYGGSFLRWLASFDSKPYNSWGNGSAMRVSAVGWMHNTMEAVLKEAERSAAVTHDHPEGIKGAQAVAAAVFLARTGGSKETIREFVKTRFQYDLDRQLDDIRPHYGFDVSCQGSVPEAILAFLESTDYEHAVRLAVSLGGDADTQACIAGSIAGAFYSEIPQEIAEKALAKLPKDIRGVVEEFSERCPV